MSERADKTTDLTRGIYRRVYAGFLKGRRINRLSLQAEAWFWRVNALADDYGNLDGDPVLFFTATVGRRAGVSPEDVVAWLAEMESVGLVKSYEVAGDRYLHVVGFIEIQPAGRTGRRVRRVPASPWEPKADGPVAPHGGRLGTGDEESGSARKNPEAPGGIRGSDTDTDTHSESDTQTESENKLAALASVEPAPQASTAAAVASPVRSREMVRGPVVMEFETVGGKEDGPKTWPLTEEYLAELAEAFPGIDVRAECRKALGWTRANPVRRKTAKGMKQFLFGWCEREQNRGGVRSPSGTAGPTAACPTSRDQKRAALAAALRSPKS